MARGNSSYNSYYNVTAANLKNVQLPDKIRCDRCNRWKNQTNFANKRLNDLRYKIKTQGTNRTSSQGGFTATCSSCTGQQVQELECYMCRTWKGLEDFAKAQRKNPDHAKCNDCMREQLDTQPVEGDNHVDTDSSSSGDEDDYNNWNDNTSSFSDEYTSLKPSSHTASTTGILVDDLDDLSLSANESSNDAFYTPFNKNTPAASASRGRSNTPSTAWGASSSSTGFNPFQYGHPRGRSSTAASAADSTRTNRTATTGSKWAKVKAYKPEPKGKQAAKEDDSWDAAHESDTDSDDEDDDDDDDDHKEL